MQVPVTVLLKRIRAITDMDDDQYLTDEALLRWLNAATPRLVSMISRAGWVHDYAGGSIEVNNNGSEGFELEETAMAILGVYRVISATDYRQLRSTAVQHDPFAVAGTHATKYFATNGGVAPIGATKIHLRPLPSSGVYAVVYLPAPTPLITKVPGGLIESNLTLTVDAGTATITRASGSWIDAGWQEGQLVSFTGFSVPANNTSTQIAGVTDSVLTVTALTLGDETGVGAESISLDAGGQQNYVDYPNGWEEWLVLEVASQVLAREESVNSMNEERKRQIERDIERMAADRLFAQGPKVRNVDKVERDGWRVSAAMSSADEWNWL